MRVKSLMIVTIFSALLLVLMLACGDGSNEGDIYTTTGGSTDAGSGVTDDIDTTTGATTGGVPKDHTKSKNGYMHHPNYKQPEQYCVSCHGIYLSGGLNGVSCYKCHGKEW